MDHDRSFKFCENTFWSFMKVGATILSGKTLVIALCRKSPRFHYLRPAADLKWNWQKLTGQQLIGQIASCPSGANALGSKP
ncbi:MAG: hypothetical protein JWQ85_2477 [Mucilaginibacter sp.]|nr:hypothetical protein [Mucilaginibacter sp.]